jgi:hypothetical protein
MFSAVHPTTDIAKVLRHVRFVARSDIMPCDEIRIALNRNGRAAVAKKRYLLHLPG